MLCQRLKSSDSAAVIIGSAFIKKRLETVLRRKFKIRLHAEATDLGSPRVRNQPAVWWGVCVSVLVSK